MGDQIELAAKALTLLREMAEALTTGPGFAIALIIIGQWLAIFWLVRGIRNLNLRHEEDLREYRELIGERFSDYRYLLRIHDKDYTASTEVAGVLDAIKGRLMAPPPAPGGPSP